MAQLSQEQNSALAALNVALYRAKKAGLLEQLDSTHAADVFYHSVGKLCAQHKSLDSAPESQGVVGSDSLLAEVSRRGVLVDLHGAVGALYDNLVDTGVLDGESKTTSYLAYRLRREAAKLEGASGGADFWQEKIDGLDQDHADTSGSGNDAKRLGQGELADQAFAEYEFGAGVIVTDVSGWEYTSPGHERTRKVYVETAAEDDGPAPRWVLDFTVKFDPETGALSEAYAMDNKGQVWGSEPSVAPMESPAN